MKTPPASSSALGSIITFYSYKGGTGRSMALANVGCLLAHRQTQAASRRGVLLVDWDLEAPGLHRFFRERFRRKFAADAGYSDAVEKHAGLIDLFERLSELVEDIPAGQQEPGRDEEARLRESLDLRDFVLETDIESLDLLKAGRFGDDYPARVNTFGWEKLYERAPWLIPWFGSWLAEHYEYVLIDSRTGVTDTSGICTTLLPEKLVVVFTPNLQSTLGAVDQIARATTYRRRSDDLRPLVIYPLPSRIETDLKMMQELWRFDRTCGYQPRFEELFKRIYRIAECDLTEYFNKVQVPQVRDYAYGEEIAVLVERGAETFSLTTAYSEFTNRLLAGGEPWELPSAPETRAASQEALRRAYAAMARLSPEEAPVAKRVLARLVRLDQRPEDGPDTARRVNLSDLGDLARPVVAGLVEAGVLRAEGGDGEQFIELADPSLATDWTLFREWIESDREFLLWRQRLDDDLAQWRSGEKSSELLLHGAALTRAEEFAKTREEDINPAEWAFIVESSRVKRRALAKRRARAGWISSLALLGILISVASVDPGRLSAVGEPILAVLAALLAGLGSAFLTREFAFGRLWVQAAGALGIFALVLFLWPALAPRPGYRVRVNILGPQGKPLEDATVQLASVGGGLKKLEGGWEADIPAAAVPADHKVLLAVGGNRWRSTIVLQLGNDLRPVVGFLTARGQVRDEDEEPISDARVMVVGHETEAVATDKEGGFTLAAHAAARQLIRLHADKLGYVPGEQLAVAGGAPVTLILKARFALGVFGYKIAAQKWQALLKTIKDWGFVVGMNINMDQPADWLAREPTVFFYDAEAQRDAQDLAEALRKSLGVSFRVKQGAGLGVEQDNRRWTLNIHLATY